MVLALIVALSVLVPVPAQAVEYDTTAVAAWRTDGTGEVRAFADAGGVVYVGGSFQGVTDGPGGTSQPQARLAAFDELTGAWLPGFAPSLNGTVNALAVSPDGQRLFVGGEFTTVNGASVEALVELDPATGDTVGALASGTEGRVYDLDLAGNYLYVVGNLTRVGAAVVSGVGRVDLTTGLGDTSWTPAANGGSTQAVAIDLARDRAYLGGFFQTLEGAALAWFGAVRVSDDGVGLDFQPGLDAEIFDLALDGDKIYAAVGGPGGRANVHDATTGRLLASHLVDGDVQAVVVSGEHVYAGHHGSIVNGQFHPWLVALDRADDSVDADFLPDIDAVDGAGIWALHEGAAHLWVGGDIVGAAPVDGEGFLRLPPSPVQPDDTTAPTTPGALTADVVADTYATLSWGASIDGSGAVYYRVYRDGLLAGVTNSESYLDESVTSGTTVSYQVTAVDASLNESAATSPLIVATLPALNYAMPFDLGSTWTYYDLGGSVPAGWDVVGFDDAAWESGPGELGRNDGDEATVLDEPAGASVTVYLRHEFEVTAGETVPAAMLDYVRDDGVLIRVNGQEVVRDNLPNGPIDETTRATSWLTATEDLLVTRQLDPVTFVPGTNVISVELHNASSTGDVSFDARLLLGSIDDTTPPSAPTALSLDEATDTTVTISWNPSTDDTGVTSYGIFRDGALLVGTTPGTTFQDTALSPSTQYSYEIVANDAAGNASSRSLPLVVTTTDPVIDTDPPSVPSGLSAPLTTDASIALIWTASSDDVGVAGYDIWRDGTVVGTTSLNNYVDMGLSAGTSYLYEVEAFDAAGNRSGRSPAVAASTEVAPPEQVELLGFGSEWRYDDTGVYPGAAWVTASFDDAAWTTGTGSFGVGNGTDTVIAARPAVWLRNTFLVADPAQVVELRAELVADDGAVVFINGIEVVRDNMPAGPVDGSVPAATYRWGAAESQARVFSIPPGVLQAGANVVAVAAINAPGSSDMSSDLRIEADMGAGGAPDVTPPSQPQSLAASSVGETTLSLLWAASTDDTGVAGYEVWREGALHATTVVASFADTGLTPATSYTYEIIAVDGAGNRSPASEPLVATTAAAPPAESVVLDFGSTWRYLDSGVYPGAAWTASAFDDAGWASGPAVLGASNGQTTTIDNQPTMWFRTTFEVTDVAAAVDLRAEFIADDGVVVFVNGVELARDNIGPGAVDGTTPASSYRWGAAETALRTANLGVADLLQGTNTIAVALVNAPGSSDSSFDLSLILSTI